MSNEDRYFFKIGLSLLINIFVLLIIKVYIEFNEVLKNQVLFIIEIILSFIFFIGAILILLDMIYNLYYKRIGHLLIVIITLPYFIIPIFLKSYISDNMTKLYLTVTFTSVILIYVTFFIEMSLNK